MRVRIKPMQLMRDPDYIIYSDGGARGNPGPAAYGFVIFDNAESVVGEQGAAIGETTNNVAEYRGVIEGLKALRARLGKQKAKAVSVEARMDSELVAKQMNGEYKVKGENIIPLFVELTNTARDFSSVAYVHVPREKNQRADGLVNEALDGGQGGLPV